MAQITAIIPGPAISGQPRIAVGFPPTCARLPHWPTFHIPEYGIKLELRPADLLVLYRAAAHPAQRWTYAALAASLGVSSAAWDRQLEDDATSGKLDALLAEADEDYASQPRRAL